MRAQMQRNDFSSDCEWRAYDAAESTLRARSRQLGAIYGALCESLLALIANEVAFFTNLAAAHVFIFSAYTAQTLRHCVTPQQL